MPKPARSSIMKRKSTTDPVNPKGVASAPFIPNVFHQQIEKVLLAHRTRRTFSVLRA